VYSQDTKYTADELYLCAPAYKTAQMIHGLSAVFSGDLGKINYASVVIVGLVYKKQNIKEIPQGFGYLIPSLEKKKVLGVLFESNIFVNRSPEDQMMFRIMIGGSRHPDILDMKEDDLKELAMDELRSQFTITEKPQQIFFASWLKAIPQYDQTYVEVQRSISEHLQQWPNLMIVSNYWNGITLNDCIENAFQAAQHSSF